MCTAVCSTSLSREPHRWGLGEHTIPDPVTFAKYLEHHSVLREEIFGQIIIRVFGAGSLLSLRLHKGNIAP